MGLDIAIDRGGTFTDVYANNNGEEIIFKLLSVDPANYEDAPTEGIRRVLEKVTGKAIRKTEKLNTDVLNSVRMGTTVATNALLERKGDRVAFLVTKGFGDVLTIGQQTRPAIFDLKVAKLKNLCENVYEIDERVTLEQFTEDPQPTAVDWSDPQLVNGISQEAVRVLRKPDLSRAREILQGIWDTGIRSLAICFMHSYIYPEHEQAVAQVAQEIGFTDISISSKLQPMIKLVARANSATADAYLSPITARYIEKVGRGFDGGLDKIGYKLMFMQSDGGLTSWKQFSGLKAILSGPAGGVVGYARTSYQGQPVLGFDMGGTSTDVSRFNGTFEHVFETTTAQVTIQAPQLDIHTVAAGGGSILFWKNGLFVVGPESASAHPGPACYRKDGPLTVTDANLLLGRIDVDSFPHIFGPSENEPLDVETVQEKFKTLTEEVNRDREGHKLTSEEVALGFLTVANETMARPIRSLTEGKGYTASNHVLSSFGGAGGQHACDVALNLGIESVVIHKNSSILSAYGMALADIVAEAQRPESISLSDEALVGLSQRLDELEQEARGKLLEDGLDKSSIRVERYLNLRYQGSETFLMIPEQENSTFADDFVAQHRQEFGFTLEREILVGDVRVRAISQTQVDEKELLPDISHETRVCTRSDKTKKMFFGSWVEAKLFNIDELTSGDVVEGPAMILDKTQTIVVVPGSFARICPHHVLLDVKSTKGENLSAGKVDPIQLSVFGHRFMSIAEQMGHTLQKTSISTNIKERLDFSCALFSPDGGLVANAPHIPVHLGSMSSAVAFQQKLWENNLEDGDVLVANHPAYGGSHLPDITVITPVFGAKKEIIFWVASRGHHSDIGGITAGSMPPFSQYLWQEGAMIKGFKVVKNGKFDYDGMVKVLYEEPAQYPGCTGSRSLSDSISDLKAQIAANNKGISLIKALANEFSLDVVQLYMHAIQNNAEQSVRQLLKDVAAKYGTKLHSLDYLDDGTPIELSISIDKETGSATFDFEGTGKQIHGNLNAPKAITYSAILYCLRSMIQDDIPLNQGCLAPINVKIPEGSLLSPNPDRATVGGNVETSQRITDVVFKAFQALAGSQGTCNNFTFGFGGKKDEHGIVSKGFGYYETVGGGAGAGPSWHGQSGVQVHMTNTRSTDPEIFEKRYPVILHEFSLRKGSGGDGQFQGGDGLVRDIEFRHPIQASILSERRSLAPYGLAGGEDGSRGINMWVHNGREISIGGKNTLELEPGDRIILRTPGGGGYGAPKRTASNHS